MKIEYNNIANITEIKIIFQRFKSQNNDECFENCHASSINYKEMLTSFIDNWKLFFENNI